jgi:PAS domain S-box-containing protein
MADDVDILVVDDRREDLLVIESILGDRGYNLVTASSATAALRRVLEHDFAAILLDVRMPDMDGFELASFIKQRERSRLTPIIFLTAVSAEIGSIYRGYSVGAVDYLMKPLDPDVLRAKVGIFVELFRKDRRIREQAEALRAAETARIRVESDRRYRNLAEAIPAIVWTADPDGKLTFVNRAWVDYTGLDMGTTLSQGWACAVHPDDLERCSQRWQAALASGEVFDLECRLRGKDGHHRWHLCRGIPERDDRGHVVAWLGTNTDVDDQRRARDAAEAAVRMRDEFLSIASHELRTPLTTLLLRLQSLELETRTEQVITTESLAPKIASSLRQTKRLIGLIENLLDVSRIATGKLTLAREHFDLGELVRDVVERHREMATRLRSEIDVRVDGKAVGSWDRLRVEQIVDNLVSNALKYAPGKPVEIRLATAADRAVLTVRDHGNGIAPEDTVKLFERFERGLPARQIGGLGLGLFISRQIAEAHGGSIRVASKPGEGAAFTVELPLAVMLVPQASGGQLSGNV